MTDQEIINQLEGRLGKTFKKVNYDEINNYRSTTTAEYSLDINENVNGLRLSGFQLTKIPAEIGQLSQLSQLNISNTKLSDLSGLSTLTQLKRLFLKKNQITEISPLRELKQVTWLQVSGNQISDISPLSKLKVITRLYLNGNQISDLTPLIKLRYIVNLYLNENNISDVSPLAELKEITILTLFDNPLSDISPLKGLLNMKELWLRNNKISDLAPLRDLRKIVTLDLDHNELHDISPLQGLPEITKLYLSDNQITDISALQNLRTLKICNLNNNPIKQIPSWITGFDMDIKWGNRQDGFISFYNNLVESPPIEILKQGKKAIKEWFEASKKKLNEIKVLLVGEAKAGKTSLCNRLKSDRFNADQKQTDGIIIEEFAFGDLPTFKNQKKLHDTTAYFWDFGGQEIMSSTHQFFMTKRSAYILLLEARRDAEADKQVRRWLERIQTFGGNSPVIVVGNKIDLNPAFGFDTTSLQKEFPQIKYFINVSCDTGENIERLKALLEECIPQAELFETKIDERWINIKTELQRITGEKSKLTHDQFIEICNKYGLVETESQSHAISFLNDLGIVLHFNDLNLSEYYVLDPLWVTAGVYRIITSETAARQKGEVKTVDLPRIINEEIQKTLETKHLADPTIRYSPNECRFLADIMAEFKLSYYADNRQKILIPDLLEKETPRVESERFEKATDKLSLVYEYKYMPPSIMPRLIVELKADVEIAWRTGVILNCKRNIKAQAMVTAGENRIKIIVVGEHREKRDYLSIIRYFIEQINENFNVKVNILIPLPGQEDYSVKYEILMNMDRAGEKIYKEWEINKEFEISKLLFGIVSKAEVQKQVDTIMKNEQHNLKKIKIFLASSSELEVDRREIELFIGRKNNEWYDKGVFLQLTIWEHFLDAMAQTRLQDEYNKAVRDSDMFIMLFFTKVGKYTEEEFENAYSQFKEKGKPLIFTYFKDSEFPVGEMKKEDMQSLWAFQDKLDKLGHYYTKYKNISDLKLHFTRQLEGYDFS